MSEKLDAAIAEANKAFREAFVEAIENAQGAYFSAHPSLSEEAKEMIDEFSIYVLIKLGPGITKKDFEGVREHIKEARRKR